jgi:hypothetical protein
MDTDDEFPISYSGVTPGVPVLTRDGQQFGFLEHVLEVPEEDVFDGIVVWVGKGGWADRRIQRDVSEGHKTAARFLDLSEAGTLPPPTGAPVFYANAIDQATPRGPYGNGLYGGMFGRGRWTRE